MQNLHHDFVHVKFYTLFQKVDFYFGIILLLSIFIETRYMFKRPMALHKYEA